MTEKNKTMPAKTPIPVDQLGMWKRWFPRTTLTRKFLRHADRTISTCRANQHVPRGVVPRSVVATPPSHSPRFLFSCWPLEMRAETAAAYCDEPSVRAFLAKVDRGIYSAPARQKGCLPKWHRRKLEQDIARRHGLSLDLPIITEDATELI
jgi:hypothetical protein